MPVYLEYMGYCVEVPLGDTVVGRDVRCALRFNDSAVSRRHVRFSRTGDDVWVEDAGSTNGTVLNGQPLVERKQMQDNDTVELGGYRLKLRCVSRDADEIVTRRIASLSELGSLRRASRAAATTTPPTLAPEDRRRHDRRSIELRLVYTSSELEIEAMTRDLSESGVFLCTHVLDPVGTPCELTLLIDGGPPLHLAGIVRRVVERHHEGHDPVGLGIEFVEVGEGERKWLALALQRMDVTEAVRVREPD